jgi:hypothetical protein
MLSGRIKTQPEAAEQAKKDWANARLNMGNELLGKTLREHSQGMSNSSVMPEYKAATETVRGLFDNMNTIIEYDSELIFYCHLDYSGLDQELAGKMSAVGWGDQ